MLIYVDNRHSPPRWMLSKEDREQTKQEELADMMRKMKDQEELERWSKERDGDGPEVT